LILSSGLLPLIDIILKVTTLTGIPKELGNFCWLVGLLNHHNHWLAHVLINRLFATQSLILLLLITCHWPHHILVVGGADYLGGVDESNEILRISENLWHHRLLLAKFEGM
jgi:hypothetical protein